MSESKSDFYGSKRCRTIVSTDLRVPYFIVSLPLFSTKS